MSYSCINLDGRLPDSMGALAPSLLDPPTVEDGGITRVAPSSLPALKWSVSSTTSWDETRGATVQKVEGAGDTYLVEVVPSTPGDQWIDSSIASGYAILFEPKPPTELTETLTFVTTKEPDVLRSIAGPQGSGIYVDGPGSILAQAKDGAPPVEPPGPGVPTTTVGYAPPCKQGDMEVFGLCYPILGLPTPPVPGGKPPVPGGTPPQPAPPPQPSQPPQPTKTAGMGGAPGWLLPVLVGAGALSVFALVRSDDKRNRRRRSGSLVP